MVSLKLLDKNEVRITRLTGRSQHKKTILSIADTRKIDQMMKCWQLRVKGYQIDTIAKQVGISAASVIRRLAEAKERLDNQILLLQEDASQQLVDRLEWVFVEATGAWDKSKTTEITSLEDGAELVVENPGDPRFLVTALETLKTKQKLLGLGQQDANTIVNVNVTQQITEALTQRDRMSDIARELQKLGLGDEMMTIQGSLADSDDETVIEEA